MESIDELLFQLPTLKNNADPKVATVFLCAEDRQTIFSLSNWLHRDTHTNVGMVRDARARRSVPNRVPRDRRRSSNGKLGEGAQTGWMLTDGGVLQCAAVRENGPFLQQTQIAGRRARQGSEDDQILLGACGLFE